MVASTPSSNLGRHFFGAATLASGAVTLIWRSPSNGHPQHYIVLAIAVAQVVGGAVIQLRQTAKSGALILGVAYVVSVLLCMPQIVTAPQVYNSWGNFFEQFSLFTGAALVYASLASVWSPVTLTRNGRILLGICTLSFALEQAFYLGPTASFVPKWIPPSQMFWAIATTVLFALAAVALLANQKALLAARLLTAMVIGFGLLVWIPLVVSHPRDRADWSETAESFAIAGAVWILADLLGQVRLNDPSERREQQSPERLKTRKSEAHRNLSRNFDRSAIQYVRSISPSLHCCRGCIEQQRVP